MNHTKQELLYIPHSIKLQSPPFQNLDFKARFVIKRDHRYVMNFTFGKTQRELVLKDLILSILQLVNLKQFL